MQRCCSGGVGQAQALFQRPVFVDAEQHSGIECVASTHCADDFVLRHVDGGGKCGLAILAVCHRTFGVVDADEFADAKAQQFLGGGTCK